MLDSTTPKPANRIAAFYSGIRGSSAFLIVLTTFIVVWLSLNFVFGFDPDWGGLNLCLSIEASLGVSLYMVVSSQQDAILQSILSEIREQNRMILHLEQAQVAQIEALSSFIRNQSRP